MTTARMPEPARSTTAAWSSASARMFDDEAIATIGCGAPVIVDGVLGPANAEQAREAVIDAWGRGELTPAGLGRRGILEDGIRGDLTAWLDPHAYDPRLRPVLGVFHRVRDELNEIGYFGLRRSEIQIAAYLEGAGYDRHLDAFEGLESRRLTVIYYANPSWMPGDGGELQVWTGEGTRAIEPRGDRLVVFRSERLEHSVRPVVHGARVAITAWFWPR